MERVKLSSNEDLVDWITEQEEKYGSWGVCSEGKTIVPIEYPCIVLGYVDSTYNTLYYDFVYLCDFD